MENYTSTFLALNSLWKDGNKPEFTRYMQESLNVAADPYKMVSVCIKLCPDLFKNRSSGMPANIIVELMSFLGKGNYQKYEHCLNEALQVDMFHVSVRQKNVGLMRLFVKAFQLERIKMLLLPHIQEMQTQGQLKEVATLATLLNLQDEFSTEDLIVPLFLQDRLSLADEFLLTSPRHQKEILSFIDNIIGKQVNINDLHKTYKIKDPKKVKSSKMLCNTVAKLLKKFDLDASICPHMQKHRARGALRYIFYKYYIEKGIQVQAFQSLIDDALKESPHLGLDLMHLFDEYHDLEAAAPYVRKLQLHADDIPVRIKEVISAKPHLTDGNMDAASVKQLAEEECWDDGRLDFYSLNVPLEEVVIVTSVEEFTKCMSLLMESPVIAMDSEWKPTFGIGSAEQASLLQMATQSRVFLLDLVALQPLLEDSHWSCIGHLFSNPKITKIGYGIRGDFKILAKLHSEVQKGFANAKNVIDLDQIKGILVEDYPEVFPHNSSNYKGLTDLVYRCFGLPLDKTDQFSNWAARPLTKSQIRYATMDVVSLIDIHTFLGKKAQELDIEDWRNIRPKKGKEKVKKDRPVRKQIPKTHEDMQKVMNKEPILAADFHVICDTMVQGLAKKLRCFGIDAEALETGESCDKCIEYYEKEKRVVLTKGSAYERLAKFIPSSFIYMVQKESANQQVEEIINVFNVKVTVKDIFARCPKCNSASYLFIPSWIIRSLKENVDINMTDTVPDKWVQCEGGEVNLSTGYTRQGIQVLVAHIAEAVILRTETFYVCAQCGRCYWDGSHYERIINGRLSDIVQGGSSDSEVRKEI